MAEGEIIAAEASITADGVVIAAEGTGIITVGGIIMVGAAITVVGLITGGGVIMARGDRGVTPITTRISPWATIRITTLTPTLTTRLMRPQA